ncbi:VaFE repeat-containing surface-anchored protein [Bilifractor sp. HCP3S3_D3]|uniref:VaFE repeat-containing surface-anchored protein n=1 Tax=Bilifractor sp. HCP3S3_D3 TaxID=3438907 RepID=UPI003F8B9A22
MRKIQKTLNIILAAALAVTSFPATTFAGESVKSSSASVSSASISSSSESSILMKDTDEAEDTVMEKSDLSSARLLVGTDDASVVADDQDHILSSYDGLYLIQYPSEKAAKKAYDSYLETADFVDIDNASLSAADSDTDITDVTEDHVMTEESNPLTELADAPSGNVKKGTIALIDTGASKGGNVTEAVSMLGDDASDDNGHGTQMAGYITEEDPDARILSIKALDANGNGTPSSVTAAIKYAIERKVSVINLSLSGTKTAETSAVEEAVKEAVQTGIVVIGAAGNNGKNAKYYIPGGIDEAIIAGAADEEGQKIKDTNYGDTVDYYVAAASTSEAAARLSGIYSKEGKIAADNKTIFTTVATDNSKTDEDTTDSTSDGIKAANGGSGSEGASGGGAIGNVHGFFVWHDGGSSTNADIGNDNQVTSKITDFRTQWIQKVAIGRTLNSIDYNNVTNYVHLYNEAARTAILDAATRSNTNKARVVGAIGIYTIGNDNQAYPVYNYPEKDWYTLTHMRADNGSGLPGSTWASVHYNNGQATSENWREWLYEYGLNKVRASATFNNTTVIVYAVAENEPSSPPSGGKIKIRLDKYLQRMDTGGQQKVTGSTSYDNSDFTFEVKMRNYGGSRPSKPSVSDGTWYPFNPSTIHPGQEYSMDTKGVAGSYSSISDWVAKNKYYVIAYRETGAPSGVTKDPGRDGDGWNYAILTMSASGTASVALAYASESVTNTYRPPSGELKIKVNKYVDGTLVTNYGTYTNSDFQFEAKMRDFGGSYPRNYSVNNGDWYPWGETLYPGQEYTRPVTGTDRIYSSTDDWVAGNRYYVIAVKETKWPGNVTPDTGWKYIIVEMTANGSTRIATPSGGTPTVDVQNYVNTPPPTTTPTPTPTTTPHTTTTPTPTPTTPPATPKGSLRLHKSSSNPEMTEGNPCYTLKGAVYGVYKDKACTQDTGKRLATNANGDTNTVELEVGTYYVKELTAPKGYVLSNEVKGDTLTEGTTKTIEVTDTPGNDPIAITINKNTANATANVPSLEGTEFTVKYYNNYYSSLSELPEKATRTWVFAAKYRSTTGLYTVVFNNTYKVGGDELYTIKGSSGTRTAIPYGTITIQESKAATGYENDASFTESNGTSYGSVVLARVDDSGNLISVKTGNSLSDTSLDVNDTLIPVPSTSLRNEEGSQYTEAKKDVKLTDTVSIKNLNSYIGKTITVSGTLYDKTTGQPLSINGKTVTASTTLNVTSETGEVKNVFTFDAAGMQGKTVVATESILVDGKEIVSHKDLNDTEQMVFFPKISTILYQDVNGDKTANDGEKIIAFDLDKNGKPVQAADDTKAFDTNVTLTDQVIYENLAPSKVYEVTGKLMKVNADGSLTDTGIRSKETSFTTGKATSGNLTASGSADIHYSFDAMQYQNCQLVAFETLNLSGESVSAREEENIEAQRIRILVSTPKKVVSKVSNNRYEIHTWSITTKIPSGMEDSKPEQRGASFTDVIDSRLDYKGNVRVDVVDSEKTNANILLTLSSGDYTISGATEGTAGGTLKVTLTASGLEKISKKQYEGVDYLRLRFDTLINSTAEITPENGVDIPNKVEIRWDDLGKVLLMHGDDHVTSGSVRIMKIDNNHQSLAGAKFVLLKADKSRYQQNNSTGANPKDYPEQVSGADGYVTWTGLEDGTYYIRETAAPNGKELQADDIKVVLKDHKVTSVNDTQVTNPVFRVADSGKLTLQTGGPGRMIILVVSIAAIALAIFALLAVMKRQKGNEA